jgi:mRNA-degrading endonuclease RelE of RelBE toxin-antitoxin system
VKSVTSTRFRKAFEKLPKEIQQRAKQAYLIWKDNPHHPGLNYKQIHETQPIFSVRVSLSYRAIGIKEEDVMIWFWIGSHEDYNNLIKQL